MNHPPLARILMQRSLVLLLIVGASVALLTTLYTLPVRSTLPINSSFVRTTGLYPSEQNAERTYAYTRGTTDITLATDAVGWYIAILRIAGPGGTVPVSATVQMQSGTLALGTIKQERVYSLLLPSTEQGDVQFQLHSSTARVPNDRRDLGVLIEQVGVESLSLSPPMILPLLLAAAVCVLWVATSQLPASTLVRYGLLVAVAALASIGLGTVRNMQVPFARGLLLACGLFTVFVVARYFDLPAVWTAARQRARTADRHAKHADYARLATALRVVTPIFVAWRLGLWIVSALALWFSQRVYTMFPARFRTHDSWHRGELIDGAALWHAGGTDRAYFIRKFLVDGWLQWDGHRYVAIVNQGYEYNIHQPNIAFFPLLPMLTSVVRGVTGGDPVIAALVVTQVALYAGLLLLYDLVATDWSAALGRRTIWALLLFPAAVFLGAIYTEALAIALAVAVVWALRRERWWLAGIAGYFLALCRLPGVLVAPVIALCYIHAHGWHWRSLVRAPILASALPVLGLATFMAYQWRVFGTPFAFYLAQRDWENQTSLPWVLPRAMFRAFWNTANLPLEVMQLTTWVSFIALVVLAIRWLPLPYWLTMVLLLVPPYLSSWPRSFSRYVLPAFPAFLVIAMLCRKRWVRITLLVCAVPLLIGALVVFVNGFWLG